MRVPFAIRSMTSHITARSLPAAVAVLALLGVAGCGKDDNPVQPAGGGDAPHLGSSYSFEQRLFDDEGNEIFDWESGVLVTDIGVDYFGRHNVTVLTDSSGGTQTRIIYEPNGDQVGVYRLTNFDNQPVDSAWIVYPLGSGKTTQLPTISRTFMGDSIKSSGSIEYLGEERITVMSESFDTRKLRMKSMYAQSEQGRWTRTMEFIDTLWYAPRIAYYVRSSGVQIIHSDLGDHPSYSVTELTAYMLK